MYTRDTGNSTELCKLPHSGSYYSQSRSAQGCYAYLDTTIDIFKDFNLLVPDQVAPVPNTQAYSVDLLASLTGRPILSHFLFDRSLLQDKSKRKEQ